MKRLVEEPARLQQAQADVEAERAELREELKAKKARKKQGEAKKKAEEEEAARAKHAEKVEAARIWDEQLALKLKEDKEKARLAKVEEERKKAREPELKRLLEESCGLEKAAEIRKKLEAMNPFLVGMFWQ